MGNCMCIPSGKVRSKLQALKHVPHTVNDIFDQYAGEKGVLNLEDVQQILKAQGIDSSEAHARLLIIRCQKEVADEHHHLHFKGHTMKRAEEGQLEMDLAGFFALLLDADINGVHDVSKVTTHDMSQPLSHYYWYTSHNSYLMGNQLTSDSSAVPIVDALKRGCRVIELDVWPDGENIKVVHGMTLCNPAPVVDLLMAIKEHAFVASEYPVVLTIENHLPIPLQKLLAQHLRDILGDELFIPTDPEGPLLSPKDLIRRFIISDKPITETEEGVKGAKKAKGDAAPGADDFLREGELDETEGTTDGPLKVSGTDGIAAPSTAGTSTAAPGEEDAEAVMSATVSNEAVPEYDESFSSLIYIPCLKPNEYVGAFKGSKKVTMANVSEPAFEKLAQSGPTLLTKFAKNNVMRVYPFGLRFDSSNLDPTKAWAYGAQLAAINMQGYGRHLWLQHGLFLANGGCGYVKKPDFFYAGGLEGDAAPEFNPGVKGPVKTTLKIKIISGRDTHKRFDALKSPDFFVRVAIYGVPADKKKYHTKTHKSTKHPIWEKEEFAFPLTVPELALLAIEVRESDTMQRDDFACQTCIPVSELKTGLRAIAMKDKRGNVIPDGQAKLLVHVEFSGAIDGTGVGSTRVLETPSMRENGAHSASLVDIPLK